MINLDQVARQNLEATRQVELAARNLNPLNTQCAGVSAERATQIPQVPNSGVRL